MRRTSSGERTARRSRRSVAGADELFEVAGGEDEFGSGAGVAFGEGEAEAAGASGDEDDLSAARRLGRTR